MQPGFSVSGRISKPVHEVFEAVVSPDQLSHYFTTGGAKGRIVPGATVTWDFHDFPGAFPVFVREVVADRRIVLEWEATGDTAPQNGDGRRLTRVTMTFAPLDDGRTLLTIEEHGWTATPEGLKASYGNCEGWTGMLCALKAWLEHGIVLRQGFYA